MRLVPDAIELLEQKAQDESRRFFWAYRRYLHYPNLTVGWWQRELSHELHRFWDDYQAGLRPKLLIQSPPQHGKSFAAVDFISWIVGQRPDLKIIFASFSDALGMRANLRLRRIFANPKHSKIFGKQVVGDSLANSKHIEFAGGNSDIDRGYFINTTVAGPVTGMALDLGIIDDPIKGRAEANSAVVREKTWSWLTDDFMTRFDVRGALLLIQTRWHLDDPAGRLIDRYPGVRVLRYPAIAEQDETHMAVDAIGRPTHPFVRKAGEPLFPELKTLQFLEAQRATMTQAGWQSIYQQSPILVGGDMFPIDKVQLVPERPARSDVMNAVRYWDKAGTADGGAYSAGVLMTRMKDGTFMVVDVRRGRWSALDRERMIRQTAEIDSGIYETTRVVVEQEPGSGGKESAESTIRMLSGFSVEADKVTGAKEIRAEPFAAQWQSGNVRLVSAEWVRPYLDEAETFPVGKFKDQIDASSGAFNKLASKYRYPSSMDWIS